MEKRDIIVVGASAGGVAALKKLVGGLSNGFSGFMFIVLHMPPDSDSMLPEILSKSGPLRAVHPEDGEIMQAGTIYLAPSDHHLLLDDGRISVNKGPMENRFRPSIDALFRSAAYQYGSRVVGIILSGMLNDGTSGLWNIKRKGGVAIVQNPDDAERPEMPKSAIDQVEIDYCMKAAEIGDFISDLVNDEIEDGDSDRHGPCILERSEPASFNCPKCNGILVKQKSDEGIRFRCIAGHTFTIDLIIKELTESIEDMLWNSRRGIEDISNLLKDIKDHFQKEDRLGSTSGLAM